MLCRLLLCLAVCLILDEASDGPVVAIHFLGASFFFFIETTPGSMLLCLALTPFWIDPLKEPLLPLNLLMTVTLLMAPVHPGFNPIEKRPSSVFFSYFMCVSTCVSFLVGEKLTHKKYHWSELLCLTVSLFWVNLFRDQLLQVTQFVLCLNWKYSWLSASVFSHVSFLDWSIQK